MSLLGSSGGDVVACRDLNLDFLSVNENSSSPVFYDAVSLIPNILKTTRIASSSWMLIDNISASNVSEVSSGIPR